MSDTIQDILYYFSYDQTHWVASLVLICVFAVFERLFPRIALKSRVPRVIVILSIAAFAYAAVWLFKSSLYMQVISFLLNFQVYSISKAEMPILAVYAISLLVIDLSIYVFHFLSHKITFLWKLHSIHHADEHVDAKTAVLHHPFETLASLIFVLTVSIVLGVPLIALILYSILAMLHNLFVHANIALPSMIDRVLRYFIITPDMHRTHHSVDFAEGNSNFGQLFSIWDRLFRTYISHPATGEANLIMGLEGAEKPKDFTVKSLLLHPFRSVSAKR